MRLATQVKMLQPPLQRVQCHAGMRLEGAASAPCICIRTRTDSRPLRPWHRYLHRSCTQTLSLSALLSL